MYRSLLFSAFVLLFAFFSQMGAAQQLRINEFMASNSSTIQDPEYHNYADWIEIYNSGSTALSLAGYSITDDFTQPNKFVFTGSISIAPQGFLLIWADDHNTGLHTNFKLSASGEQIGLYSPTGQLLDSVSFGAQQTDISFGRLPDGGAQWFFFNPASPGIANVEANVWNKLSQPVPSIASGFFTAPQIVAFTHPITGTAIRFTRDGRTPTESDSLYTASIAVDTTSVIRVKAFKQGYLPSQTLSLTYFIKDSTVLPIFSLVSDPVNFFSDTSGIYVIGTNGITAHCSTAPRNWNQEWERPIDIEFFEKDRSQGFKVSAGVQIFGGCARLYNMKSLAFFFRDIYGGGKLKYQLFPNVPITEFDNFILRNSGQDFWRTMFRDGMVQTLLEQGMKLDIQAYRPSVVFLNGQYWGIHNIREKLNDHYIGEHYGYDESNLDLIEMTKGVTANNGDLTAYNSMIAFLTNNNMALAANYDYIKSIVDVDEYIDYQIAEIYAANGDWPASNMRLWRQRISGSKWRWMVSDLDFTFGGNSQGLSTTNTLAQATATNGPNWPNPPWATLMFRKMLDNPNFKNEFIQRSAVHMSTTFEATHIHHVIDSMQAAIASEIPRHKARWTQSISLGNDWITNIKVMRDFAVDRPGNMVSHYNSKFGLTGLCTLRVNEINGRGGRIFFHTVELKNDTASLYLFKNIPIAASVMPNPGYRFVKWSGAVNSAETTISFTLNANSTLTAEFAHVPLTVTSVMINEINYNSFSLYDTEDWIELYNPADNSVSLSGWKLFGNNTASVFTFPAGSIIGAKDYLVICRDTARFRALNHNTIRYIGNFPFGLGSTGERITLLDPSNTEVDNVNYLTTAPWPAEPNGTGATLELINPQSDNAQAINWKSSPRYGSPGRLNSAYTKTEEAESSIPADYFLYNNYPNPFNPTTTISYQIPQNGFVSLVVYDALGREMQTLVNEEKAIGKYSVEFNAVNLPSGVYFYTLKAGEFISTKKLMLVK